MNKEQLIEACEGKVFKCETEQEWNQCVEKVKSLGIEPVSSFSIKESMAFLFSCGEFCRVRINTHINSTAQDFLNLFQEDDVQTDFSKLDKILDNIKSLKEQKKVIQDRLDKADSQLVLFDDDFILAEYVEDDDCFRITEEGGKSENIHIVKDWLCDLLETK